MENVLTVKRELIENFLPEAGITTKECDKVVDIILAHHEFIPRPAAEDDFTRKQIIPYVVITRGDEVFTTRRLSKGGESRLHGLISIGIGGHINPEEDGDKSDVLYKGMIREIKEEVYVEEMGELVPRGLINDDTNEVGKVHMGLFYTMEVKGQVSVRETEKLEGLWMKKSELVSSDLPKETWTSLVLEVL